MNKSKPAKLLASFKAGMSKHSPEILTGLGIVGMISTAVLVGTETPKALKLIDEKKKELNVDKLSPIETVKTVWKPYLPAFIVGATSIGCLIGANSVHIRRHTALVTAYKLSETALTEYREKVVETIGERKEQTVQEKVAQKQIDKTPVSKSEVFITGDGESLCLDPLSKRYFKSNIDRIRKAENSLNQQMLHDICGSASLNDFYDEIGLDRTDEVGDMLGWNTEHLIKLNIRPGMSDDEKPCLVIGHYNAPKYGY
jgi:hypothetical protein